MDRIWPSVELLTGFIESTYADALRGIPCLACGDRESYWLSHTQIPGSEDSFRYISRCRITLYSSSDCQRADWADHKQRCESLGR